MNTGNQLLRKSGDPEATFSLPAQSLGTQFCTGGNIAGFFLACFLLREGPDDVERLKPNVTQDHLAVAL
jgi:hypothetical protein